MIILVAAIADNGVIGKDGKMPWHVGRDLRRFKEMTTDNIILMGRKTYNSIGSLPKRWSIVISRTKTNSSMFDVVYYANSFENALAMNESAANVLGMDDMYVIGGAEIYAEALKLGIVDRMEITRMHCSPDGDVRFPEIDWSKWELVSEEFHEKQANETCDFSYCSYLPKKS